MNDRPCPCGSQLLWPSCCGPYIEGTRPAPNPEALMRSRYTAFFLDNIAYLKQTWHPDTYPDELSPGEPGHWVGLEIIESWEDEKEGEGEVEFRARFLLGNKLEILHERSDFEKIDGRWVYHSGEFLNDGAGPRKVAPGDPCPCGQAKPFKDCHKKLS